jgi:hypothetical protein
MRELGFNDRLEVAYRSNYPAYQLDDPIHRRLLLPIQGWLHAKKLRLGEEGRERVIELMLDERSQSLQLGLRRRLCRRRRSRGRPSHGLTRPVVIRYLNLIMIASPIDPAAEIESAVAEYRDSNNFAALLDRLLAISAAADLDALIAAVEPYRDLPEVAGPVYERVVAERPTDARALVILANAYWLTGRGPDAVNELATRAMAADPTNRGAWHLWALSEPTLRERVMRWRQVADRFPEDELARANLADNAASLASTERDREALQIALRTYKGLLRTATHPDQRQALDQAITTLEQWSL